MPADAQTNHGSSAAHVQWFSTERLEQMIMTSLYDVTRVSHATVGGNHKRRAQPSLRAAITVVWVFQHKHLGL